MERRRVSGRVLGFLIGSAGVVLAVFVVLPWLATPDESVDRREPLGAIVEEALDSFGEENAAEEGDTGNGTVEESAVIAAPSVLLPMGGEGPAFAPDMEPRPTAGTAQMDADHPQAADDETETHALKEAAVLTSDAGSAGTGPEVEWEDGPPGTEGRLEPVAAMPDVSVAPEAVPAESFQAAQEVARAPEAPQTLGMPLPIPVEPTLPTEPVRHTQPLPGSGSLLAGPTHQSTRSGLPRLEFEAPEAVQVDETPLQAGDRPPSSNPTVLAEPLSEFFPRSFSGSAIRRAADAAGAFVGQAVTLDRREAQAGAPQAYRAPMPSTLRGVMGYRLPLVSRQELPDQVVSGVLIPAHTTYVILQPGYWELVGLSPDDVNALRAATEKANADQQASQCEPAGRGWNPFRLFRKRRAPASGN